MKDSPFGGVRDLTYRQDTHEGMWEPGAWRSSEVSTCDGIDYRVDEATGISHFTIDTMVGDFEFTAAGVVFTWLT